MPSDFLDTNVLIYAYDTTDIKKHRQARDLIEGNMARLTLSPQVLAEFSVFMLHKKTPRARPAQMERALQAFAPMHLVTPDPIMVARAAEAHAAYGVHFYDGMIIAAAERAGCTRIWTENLNPGQSYFGVRVENPFQLEARRSRS
ncbi:MAG: PIN domain-containing protein [Acidobacteriota bacterium]